MHVHVCIYVVHLCIYIIYTESNILLISEECTDTGNNPNSSVPLSREQSISRIPEEVSVYEEDQCIEGRERLIVQCTDSDEQSITTVGVCSAQEIQYRSVRTCTCTIDIHSILYIDTCMYMYLFEYSYMYVHAYDLSHCTSRWGIGIDPLSLDNRIRH